MEFKNFTKINYNCPTKLLSKFLNASKEHNKFHFNKKTNGLDNFYE